MESSSKKLSASALRFAVYLLLCVTLAAPVVAQSQQQENSCTFENGKQISVRYDAVKSDKKLPKKGEVWAPGDSPILLFTQTDLTVGGTVLAPGAYSMYVIPGAEKWNLVVNKNVTPGSKYEPQQDLVRVTMDTANVNSPMDRLNLAFGRVGPKQCHLRIYYGKIAAFGAEFNEK